MKEETQGMTRPEESGIDQKKPEDRNKKYKPLILAGFIMMIGGFLLLKLHPSGGLWWLCFVIWFLGMLLFFTAGLLWIKNSSRG